MGWKTISIPDRLAGDIQKLIDELGYWPSIGAFAREALIRHIRYERELLNEDARTI